MFLWLERKAVLLVILDFITCSKTQSGNESPYSNNKRKSLDWLNLEECPISLFTALICVSLSVGGLTAFSKIMFRVIT